MNNSDDILNSLEGMQRARCPEGIAEMAFARYKQKPQNSWDRAVLLFSNPLFAAACITGIIIINFLLVVMGNGISSGQIANSDLSSLNASLFDTNDSYTKP